MSEKADFDREAFINVIELAIDCGFPISDEDMELYKQAISQK